MEHESLTLSLALWFVLIVVFLMGWWVAFTFGAWAAFTLWGGVAYGCHLMDKRNREKYLP